MFMVTLRCDARYLRRRLVLQLVLVGMLGALLAFWSLRAGVAAGAVLGAVVVGAWWVARG